MSDKRPYEEIDQPFHDLPMPDEEASWQKMKQLLNDDDDDIIPPPIFFRSCLGWGLLFVGLIAAWLIIRPERWWGEDQKTEQTSSSNKTRQQTNETTSIEKKSVPANSIEITEEKDRVVNPKQIEARPLSKLVQKDKPVNTGSFPVKAKKPTQDELKKIRNVVPDRIRPENLPEKNDHVNITGDFKSKETDTSGKNSDTLATTKNPVVQEHTKPADSSGQQKPGDSALQRRIQPKKTLLFAAGIGEQQQIPIAGQTAVPYSSYGRKGSIADYIPSVFVRVQKGNKWFVQGEFRYGGAQSVREFSFARKTTLDTAQINVTTTTQRLKKTYYHQFPVSFNYYVRPNLSVGFGGMYSRFYRAVTEKETKVRNIQTGDETVVKQIVPIKQFTDSFLYKTQVHVLLQADYQWRKFSFGLRYTKDVQPYIKYTRPDGTINEEKNQSLQLIIRYRLLQRNL